MTSMVTEHRETERKYEADSPILTLPPLHDLPGVASVSEPEEEVLDAGYYDTSDLRLLRAGVTLRRRRGGADEGWHLELPRPGFPPRARPAAGHRGLRGPAGAGRAGPGVHQAAAAAAGRAHQHGAAPPAFCATRRATRWPKW